MKIENILGFAVAAIALSSCSLDEDTSGLTTPDNYFRKYSECQMVVNGCYPALNSIVGSYSYEEATDISTDLVYGSDNDTNGALRISPANPGFGNTVWTYGYRGVARCNYAVVGIESAYEKGNISEDQYNQIICEAKTLRGLYYYILTCFFGDVPFYFDDVSDNEVLERIRVLPRMDATETRNSVIEDLWSVAPYAPQTRTWENDGARAGASTAYMLIAKMAMWNEDWSGALEALERLEDIYGDFGQYDLEENVMFRYKNSPESIFEIQHIYEEGGLSYTGTLCPHLLPVRSDGCVYAGVEIPELGDNATAYASTRPNTYYYNTVLTQKSGDLRYDLNLMTEYNGQSFGSSRPYPGPKFWCLNMQNSADGNNYKVFRYADVMLMMAECYANLDNYDRSVYYLNFTRNRAGIGDYTFRTKIRLLEEIRLERGRELLYEWHRKYDLVRWGIWYEETYEYTNGTNKKANMRPCHRYYPIPDEQVALSRYNLDNKEYEAYGL